MGEKRRPAKAGFRSSKAESYGGAMRRQASRVLDSLVRVVTIDSRRGRRGLSESPPRHPPSTTGRDAFGSLAVGLRAPELREGPMEMRIVAPDAASASRARRAPDQRPSVPSSSRSNQNCRKWTFSSTGKRHRPSCVSSIRSSAGSTRPVSAPSSCGSASARTRSHTGFPWSRGPDRARRPSHGPSTRSRWTPSPCSIATGPVRMHGWIRSSRARARRRGCPVLRRDVETALWRPARAPLRRSSPVPARLRAEGLWMAPALRSERAAAGPGARGRERGRRNHRARAPRTVRRHRPDRDRPPLPRVSGERSNDLSLPRNARADRQCRAGSAGVLRCCASGALDRAAARSGAPRHRRARGSRTRLRVAVDRPGQACSAVSASAVGSVRARRHRATP